MEYRYRATFIFLDETKLSSEFTSNYEMGTAHYLYNLETNGEFYFLGDGTAINRSTVKVINFEKVGWE